MTTLTLAKMTSLRLTAMINKNNEEWEEPPPVTEIDLNAIPKGKNRSGNFSQHKDSNMFSSEDEE